ncbi:hypothetical protein P7B02_14555 [Caulobacter segnis]|uniref:hypothetical protein n=1 Tax=Caulobacter segnis TaxID=88688 RepID=UPI00240FEA80|nr:hypothetical protein [Caulobacter segnis]MDG2522757.1 hypothetical protein [Caulobacter segnis]
MSRIAALAATLLVSVPSLAAAQSPASLEERTGCAVFLLTANEMAARFPEMFKGDDAEMAQSMFRLMSAAGAPLLDAAFAEGAAQGKSAAEMYRAGLGYNLDAFKGVGPKDPRFKSRGMALTKRCMAVAAPKD